MSGFNDADSEQESQQKDNGDRAALAVEEAVGWYLVGLVREKLKKFALIIFYYYFYSGRRLLRQI